MSLQVFLEKAFERGEKMKGKVLEDLMNSRLVNQLLKNEKFLNTVVAVLNAKSGIERKVHRKLNFLLKFLEVPTREEIRDMEKKIKQLEHEIETIHRRELSQSLKRKAAKAVVHPRKR
ncbi:MAG: hypothetical protein U1F57_09790 [bacterium]